VAKGNSFIGEVLHYTAVRYRLNGSGNLQTYLRSLDNINNVQLIDIAMSSLTNREPTILANFIDQRAQIEVKTTVKDETFTISRMMIFVKPIAAEYPR
jgi:hypothetical protein